MTRDRHSILVLGSCALAAVLFVIQCGGDSFSNAEQPLVDASVDSTSTADVSPPDGNRPDAGPPPAILTLEPSPLGFPLTPVGGLSEPQPLVLTNVGTGPSGALDYGLTGQEHFVVTANACPPVLPAGENCSISVGFAPKQPGPLGGALTVSATPGGFATADLTGEGQDVDTSLQVQPPVHSYGPVMVGQPASRTFTVANTGTAPISNISSQITGTDDSHFSVLSDQCASIQLDGGNTCEVVVEYRPSVEGRKVAQLQISSTLPDVLASLDGYTMDMFVNAASGDDTRDGFSPSQALRTITTALGQVAPQWTVHVEPGDYHVTHGETFPMDVGAGVTLLAKVPGVNIRGDQSPVLELAGPGATVDGVRVSSSALPPQPGGVANIVRINAAPSSFRNSSVTVVGDQRALDIGPDNPNDWVLLDDNELSCIPSSTTIHDAGPLGMRIYRNSAVTIEGNNIFDCKVGIRVRYDVREVTVRNSSILRSSYSGVDVPVPGIPPDPTKTFSGVLDLGTSSTDLGNNTIRGLTELVPAAVGLEVNISLSGGRVFAVGNTWLPDVQSANSQGRYPTPPELISDEVLRFGEGNQGQNYALATGAELLL